VESGVVKAFMKLLRDRLQCGEHVISQHGIATDNLDLGPAGGGGATLGSCGRRGRERGSRRNLGRAWRCQKTIAPLGARRGKSGGG
jgi:hypothetical protein